MNKDQWYNVLEFSRTVHADLSNYDEDGACKYSYVLLIQILAENLKHKTNFCNRNNTVRCKIVLLQKCLESSPDNHSSSNCKY